MVAAFLRFVLFAFVAWVAFLFVRVYRGLKQPRKPAGERRTRLGGVMVKDGICGTYIPREEALTEFRDGAEHHFCSEECRRQFLKR